VLKRKINELKSKVKTTNTAEEKFNLKIRDLLNSGITGLAELNELISVEKQ
jgi:hypothetical protein